MYENDKIGNADEGPPFFKNINQKNKSKETGIAKTAERKFAIILSQYRGIISTKEEMTEPLEEKDVTSWTRI